jgi:hypothetical protein
MKLLGIDPGFSSLGWAVIEIDEIEVRSIACGLITTKPNKTAKKNDDNVERCAVIHHELARIHETHSFALIAAEAQSWTRFSNADRAVAMAWGVIASTSERHGDRSPVIIEDRSSSGHRREGRRSCAASLEDRQVETEPRVGRIRRRPCELSASARSHGPKNGMK